MILTCNFMYRHHINTTSRNAMLQAGAETACRCCVASAGLRSDALSGIFRLPPPVAVFKPVRRLFCAVVAVFWPRFQTSCLNILQLFAAAFASALTLVAPCTFVGTDRQEKPVGTKGMVLFILNLLRSFTGVKPYAGEWPVHLLSCFHFCFERGADRMAPPCCPPERTCHFL